MLALTGYIFWPSLTALVLAFTFVSIFRPVHVFLLKLVKIEALAAFLTVVLVVLIVLLPVGIFANEILNQATSLYMSVMRGNSDIGSVVEYFSHTKLGGLIPDSVKNNFGKYATDSLNFLIENIGSIFQGVTGLFFTLAITLVSLFYLLKDGERIKASLSSLLPIKKEYADDIYRAVYRTVRSVIIGALLMAVLHGILSSVGYFIFGVPKAALWGMVTVFAALIPPFGAGMVYIPVIAYMIFTGKIMSGIGVAIWAIVCNMLIDNLINPKLIQRGIKIHPLPILLSVVGGIAVFGPAGFLIGPIILGLLFALLDIYPKITESEPSPK